MWGQPPPAVRGAKLRRSASELVGRCERVHKSLRPQPWIVRPSGSQASPNRIGEQVLDLGIQTLRRPQHVIKRLRLPNSPLPPESLVDPMSRCSFDRIHDLGQRADLHSFVVSQRGKDQMNMIRHHHGDAEVELLSIVMQAGFENDRTNALRKRPPPLRAKSHKMLSVFHLKMRKLSPIKSPRHKGKVMWGQPPPAVRRSKAPLGFDSRACCPSTGRFPRSWPENIPSREFPRWIERRASLARTAEGGCPHMGIAEALTLNNGRLDSLADSKH